MDKTIFPSEYNGTLIAPPSKSYMQRAIALAVLSEGTTIIRNSCRSEDSMSALSMADDLGAIIKIENKKTIIQGSKGVLKDQLNAGESGLGVRSFMPIVALHDKKITIKGRGTLNSRPIHFIESPLRQLNVEVSTTNGYLPVTIQGPIQGGKIKIDGSISSQVLTGLLIALPKAKNDSVVSVNRLQSIPYIDMTMQIISDFGIKIQYDNYEEFFINGNQNYIAQDYKIEGDWSGAAFHMVAAAISGSLNIKGLNIQSKQADRKILVALENAGAQLSYSYNSVKVKKGKLKAFHFDATHCPDLFPPLSNLAAQCKGTSIIKGIHRLIYKESNRALAIQEEWKKLGIQVSIKKDEMHITGGRIKGGKINSHNDHRIAMMGAVANKD